MDPAFSRFSRQTESPAPLFLHQRGCMVLIGERDGADFVLARGWRLRDRLTDIRRWRFSTSVDFVQQVCCLMQEETGDPDLASLAAVEASAWAALAAAIEP